MIPVTIMMDNQKLSQAGQAIFNVDDWCAVTFGEYSNGWRPESGSKIRIWKEDYFSLFIFTWGHCISWVEEDK